MKRFISFGMFLTALILLSLFEVCYAQEFQAFQGQINSDDINIRPDSTVSSQIICKVKKGERVEVISEVYDWYKIRLPHHAPSYIRKDMAECINYKTTVPQETSASTATERTCQNARVLKDRVNIRLQPNETSVILGQADKNEVINILQEDAEWYRIRPISNSFSWVHKKFVSEVPPADKITGDQLQQKPFDHDDKQETAAQEENVVIEGIVKPYGKIIKRIATHKLMTEDNKTFLLKGDKKSLNALNYRKAKVIGKKVSLPKQRYPVIEVRVLEVKN